MITLKTYNLRRIYIKLTIYALHSLKFEHLSINLYKLKLFFILVFKIIKIYNEYLVYYIKIILIIMIISVIFG